MFTVDCTHAALAAGDAKENEHSCYALFCGIVKRSLGGYQLSWHLATLQALLQFSGESLSQDCQDDDKFRINVSLAVCESEKIKLFFTAVIICQRCKNSFYLLLQVYQT